MDIGKKIKNRRIALGLTLEDVGKQVGVGKSTVQKWENGFISNMKRDKIALLANALKLNPLSFIMDCDYDAPTPDPSNVYPIEGLVSFEEIGTVKAGYDGFADEIPTGRTIEIPASMLGGHRKEDFFMLRVNGDSMYPTLQDSDSILCQRCTSVDPGTLAVVLYNGDEASVKKVNYVFGEDWMELIPDNPEYKTKRIEGSDLEQCRVLGRVVKLIRDCAPAKSFTVIKPQNKNQNKMLTLFDSLSEQEQRSLIKEMQNKKKASLADSGEIAAEGGDLNSAIKKPKNETTL